MQFDASPSGELRKPLSDRECGLGCLVQIPVFYRYQELPPHEGY